MVSRNRAYNQRWFPSTFLYYAVTLREESFVPMLTNKDFVHTHCHTDISVQDALTKPKAHAMKARAMGFPAVGITDHGRMGGVVDFVDGCRSAHDKYAPIKPLIGIEAYTCPDRFVKTSVIRADGSKGRPKHNHLTLLAQNATGYRNLLAIASIGAEEGFYYDPRVDWGVIEAHSEGVIALSGCLGSETSQALLRGDDEEAENIMRRFKGVFGDRYYAELQYHGIPEQKEILPRLGRLAGRLDIPCVASNDVHYAEAEDWRVHDILIQMRGVTADSAPGKKNGKKEAYGTHQFYLKSADEMAKIFSGKPEAIRNSLALAESVEDFLKLDVPHLLPQVAIPTDNEEFNRFWRTNMPYRKANEAYLCYLSFVGLRTMGLHKNVEYTTRLKGELDAIVFMGVVDYFLIQSEMVEFMKGSEILYGIRGSGVGSLVLHALRVCPVDPLKWGLLFERFLNPGRGTQYKIDLSCDPSKQWLSSHPDSAHQQEESVRRLKSLVAERQSEFPEQGPDMAKELWVLENQGLAGYVCDVADRGLTTKDNEAQLWTSYFLGITDKRPESGMLVAKVATLPDVDTDIDDRRRQDVIEWARGRFGKDNVAMIGTKGTYQAKAAVMGSLKVSESFQRQWGEKTHMMAQAVSKTIPTRQQPPMTIDDALAESPEFAQWAAQYPEEIAVAKRLVGTISHLGIHAGGVLVSSQPIRNVAPLENNKGVLASAYDMSAVERVGLVKYDYLGLATYQMLSRALTFIKQRHGVDVDFAAIDLSDRKVLSLYGQGKTDTIFQFASAGMKKWLKLLKPDSVEELIAMNALFRPGPLDYIQNYIDGKRNPKAVKYAHPTLERILSVTYGIPVYQEQLMALFREMAGYSWQEVDKVRKAVSKKQGAEFEKACRSLAERAAANGYSDSVITEVLKLIEAFGGYAFNKCVGGDTIVSDCVTGERSTVSDLYNNPRQFKVQALGDDWKMKPQAVTRVMSNGVKAVFTLTTRSGKRITATENHPFRTLNGWTLLENLAPGDMLATPRVLSAMGASKAMARHEIIVLGGLLSEGNTCHPSTVYYYNKDMALIGDFQSAAESFPNTVVRVAKRAGDIHVASVNTGKDCRFQPGARRTEKPVLSGLYQWADALGLTWKKATDKRIPELAFKLDDSGVSLLLGRMWSGDGFIASKNCAMPYYATSSRGMASDVQHLLLRLGITSRIQEKQFKYRGGVKFGYTVRVIGCDSLCRWIEHISAEIIGRVASKGLLAARRDAVLGGQTSKDVVPLQVSAWIDDARQNASKTWHGLERESGVCTRELRATASASKRGFRRETIERLGKFLGSENLLDLANSDVFWDTVVSIEAAGEEETFDLTVENDHNFVADGIIVHNSHATAYSVLSYWTAYLRYYYPAEWLAACMQVDKDDDVKMSSYREEASQARVNVITPNVNESGLETTVTARGEIALPLTSIKGVGVMAQAIVDAQPFTSLMDMAVRARPNRGMVQSLAEGGALHCFPQAAKASDEVMELYDEIVEERNREEKRQQKEAKKSYRVDSILDDDDDGDGGVSARRPSNGPAPRAKERQKPNALRNGLGSNSLFADLCD
jgi:DNA polymerase-3 subunit alpha